MYNLNLTKEQFSDFLNLFYRVFYPLKNFVNREQFLNIINKKKFKKHFFSFPVYFGVNKKIYNNIKNKEIISLYYEKKYLFKIKNINFFDINKKNFGKKIYGKNYNKHPYFKKFLTENFKFLNFDYFDVDKNNLKHKNFISPESFKKKYKINYKKKLAGFHTRNIPHNAHIWIHEFLTKKYKNLLVQPLIHQYKKFEYKEKVILEKNKLALRKNKKSYLIPFFSYPRYGGPREAALHAVVRKNYGCTHFWVGRDHAGYKNFFKIYESQKFCKKNEKKIGIQIVSESEPYLCNYCQKITNKRCNRIKCKNSKVTKISGSKIRRLIISKQKISNDLMQKKISKNLSIKSLIN